MHNQNYTPDHKSSRKSSSQENKRRLFTVLHSEWDARYNPAPVVKIPQGWNKDYPDVERLFSFH